MGKSAKIRHRRRRRQARRWTLTTARALKETLDYIFDEMIHFNPVDYSKYFDIKPYE